MHVKLIFLEDAVQEKLGDNWRPFYIAAAAMFVYLAMSHMHYKNTIALLLYTYT